MISLKTTRIIWFCSGCLLAATLCNMPDSFAEQVDIKIQPDKHPDQWCLLPTTSRRGQYLYVFGPTAGKGLGALDQVKIAFFRFPANTSAPITLSVFDPDCGGSNDLFSFGWATKTKFTVYGGAGTFSDPSSRSHRPKPTQAGTVLASKEFTKEFDDQWYRFGPFQASQGEVIGDWSYFKIVAQATEGGKQNNYRLAASPATAEAFTYTTSLYLKMPAGKILDFFLEVPKGLTQFTEMNYDVDASGGTAYLITPQRTIRLKTSGSGAWARNPVQLNPSETGKRLIYRFVKGPQSLTNMTFTFLTRNEKPLRIFNADGAVDAPAVKTPIKPPEVEITRDIKDPCLAFIFDASKSTDPDSANLTYEWDFGDNSPKVNKIKVLHVYEKPGAYDVTLSVNDGSTTNCAVAQTVQKVVANLKPVPSLQGPSCLRTGQKGLFDASGSKDTPGDTLSYHWDFGDGQTAEGAQAEHAYEKGGEYRVLLTVKDDKNTRCSVATAELPIRVNAPPIADAGADVFLNKTSPTEPFEIALDGSKSTDPDGDTLTYLWDFGDGTKGEGKQVTHIYPKGGNYTAKLTVKDDSCLPDNTASDEVTIQLNRAPTAIASGENQGCVNEPVLFDASRSTDLDGDKLTYKWEFGDGETGEGPQVRHIYKKPGTYNTRLTVDDGRGTNISSHTETRVVQIFAPPIAAFTPIKPVTVGSTITLQADTSKNADSPNLSYHWELSNGQKLNGPTASFTTEKGGAIDAKLIIDNGTGLACGRAVAETTIRVNTPPVASLGVDNEICCIDQPVKFNATKSTDPDGDQLSYLWDFGDGNTSTEPTPVHIYKTAGVFKITLTVTDNSGLPGNTSTATTIAKVNRRPIAVIEVSNP